MTALAFSVYIRPSLSPYTNDVTRHPAPCCGPPRLTVTNDNHDSSVCRSRSGSSDGQITTFFRIRHDVVYGDQNSQIWHGKWILDIPEVRNSSKIRYYQLRVPDDKQSNCLTGKEISLFRDLS